MRPRPKSATTLTRLPKLPVLALVSVTTGALVLSGCGLKGLSNQTAPSVNVSPYVKPTPTPSPVPTQRPSTTAWTQNFTGAAGTAIDSTLFNHETGGNGWGNVEIESYTDRTANSSLDGNGNLAITVRHENYTGPDGNARYWTSARIDTLDKFSFTYGTLSARIKIPAGQGFWPAFWLVGSDVKQVGWPQCGEIDIMESDNAATEVSATVHGPATGAGQNTAAQNGSYAVQKKADSSTSWADDYHVYSVQKQPGSIVISIDGTVVSTVTKASLAAGQSWVFDKPMVAIFNVAVGGTNPGLPDSTTPDQASMLISSLSYTP